MVVGYIFGIPITLVAVYFIVVRPILFLLSHVDSDSFAGKGLSIFGWVLFSAFVFGLLVMTVVVVIVARNS